MNIKRVHMQIHGLTRSIGCIMVAVVEEAGAVETENGGWEVGGTAEDEEERDGMAEGKAMKLFQIEPSVSGLDVYTHHVEVGKTVSKRGSPGVVLAVHEKGTAVAVVEEVEEHSIAVYRVTIEGKKQRVRNAF